MNKVISINLNGNAYQLEEKGYEALDAYLRDARRQLEGNPDIEEILTDLEQAIADKCNRFLRSGRTVVSSGDIEKIIEEMGPVRDSGDSAEDPFANTETDAGGEHSKEYDTGQGTYSRRPRRLYRLKDDKMVEGVCSGIAAYFGLDPTIIRILFVALLIISWGTVIVAYLIMAAIIPEAKTPEEHAAAHGAPFDAMEVIDRAKSKFQDFQNNAGKTHRQKTSAEYWKREDHKKVNSGLSTLLTLIVVVIGAGMLLKFLFWPLSPGFLHGMGMPVYNPWISVLVLFVLIYVLSRLVKNLSTSENGSGTLLAGILKFCLVVLVVLFAIRMFPAIFWLFTQIVNFIRGIFPHPFWW